MSWLEQWLFGAGVSISTKILKPGVAFLSTKTSAVFVMYKQLVKNFEKWRAHRLLKLMDSFEQA